MRRKGRREVPKQTLPVVPTLHLSPRSYHESFISLAKCISVKNVTYQGYQVNPSLAIYNQYE